MRTRTSNICVICGEGAANTREHVPPQGLFERPLPTNFITVPSCENCNSSSKLHDEYFRVIVAAANDPTDGLSSLWKNKVVNSTFVRSPALRNQLARDRAKLIEQAKVTPLIQMNGELLPEHLVGQVQPFDMERMNKVSAKIVSCLSFHEFGEILPNLDPSVIESAPVGDDFAKIIHANRIGQVGTENQFCYLYAREGKVTQWCLLFYNRLAIFANCCNV